MSSVGANAGRLVRIDLASGAERGAGRGPGGGRGRRHGSTPTRGNRQVVTFLKERAAIPVVLDPAVEADVGAPSAALHPGDPDIVRAATTATHLWLVGFTDDDRPGALLRL